MARLLIKCYASQVGLYRCRNSKSAHFVCFEIFIIKLLLNIQAWHWSSHSNPLSVAKESITPSRGTLRSLAHDNSVSKSVKEGEGGGSNYKTEGDRIWGSIG